MFLHSVSVEQSVMFYELLCFDCYLDLYSSMMFDESKGGENSSPC